MVTGTATRSRISRGPRNRAPPAAFRHRALETTEKYREKYGDAYKNTGGYRADAARRDRLAAQPSLQHLRGRLPWRLPVPLPGTGTPPVTK